MYFYSCGNKIGSISIKAKGHFSEKASVGEVVGQIKSLLCKLQTNRAFGFDALTIFADVLMPNKINLGIRMEHWQRRHVKKLPSGQEGLSLANETLTLCRKTACKM